jgi:hypothetical protein
MKRFVVGLSVTFSALVALIVILLAPLLPERDVPMFSAPGTQRQNSSNLRL